MKEIYYIQGSEKHGPISIADFIKMSLPNNTLVWFEGLNSWRPFEEVRQLLGIPEDITPPLPPPLPNSIEITPKTPKNKFNKYLIISVVVLAIVGASSIYMFFELKKNKFKNELIGELDEVFNGNKIVLDGINYEVRGELSATKFNGKPQSSGSLLDRLENPNWEEDKFIETHGLYGIYKKASGGFEIIIAERLDKESFSIETYSSQDMGYKKPRYEYSYGFRSDNWIPSVRQCYNSAFSYFKEDGEYAGNFVSGIYYTLASLERLQNKYFYIENAQPKSNTHLWKSSTTGWKGGEEAISNEFWIVFYERNGKNYTIVERTEVLKMELIRSYLFFWVGLGLLTLIVVGVKKF